MIRASAWFSLRLRRKVMRFADDRRGVSAVEFALVAPLMIALFLGCVDISDGVAVDRKVVLTASALANLSSQPTTISTSDMNNILDASTAIIAPYSAGPMKMTVSCISFDANKNMTIKWTAFRGTASVPTIVVDDSLKQPNTQLVYAEVSYLYTPVAAFSILGPLTLAEHMFMAPRISAPIYDGTACT